MSEEKPKTISLRRGERIIAVVPQRAQGPGWANEPVWVYIVGPAEDLRTECLQPHEQSSELRTLFAAGCAMVEALKNAVSTSCEESQAGYQPIETSSKPIPPGDE